ncbi:hypothetical protein JCM8097_001974 [Rhodosporidiobolus ruineniae]
MLLHTSLAVLALCSLVDAVPADIPVLVRNPAVVQALSKRQSTSTDLTRKVTNAPGWTYQTGCGSPVETYDGDQFPVQTYLSSPDRSIAGCMAYALAHNATAIIVGLAGSFCAISTNYDHSTARQVDASNCGDQPCLDDAAHDCGTNFGGEIYAYSSQPRLIQTYTSGSTKWTRQGCRTDILYGTRALANRLAFPASQTVEGCLDACTAAGYELCGVEYYGECWGANTLDKTSQPLSDDSCNLVCADNALEPPKVSTTTTKTTTTTTTTPASSPTPTFLQSYKTTTKPVKTYKRKGCYSDLLYGTRALPNLLAQATGQTVESCLEACAAGKYSLCGVEYRGECWGANKLDSTSQLLADSACQLTCVGNSLEYCGGTGGPSGAAFQLFSSA